MKSTLNSKGIHAGCIHGVGDSTIEFCTKRGESDRVIVGANVLLKVCSSVRPNNFAISVETCLSEEYSNWFWSIIRNGQFDANLPFDNGLVIICKESIW